VKKATKIGQFLKVPDLETLNGNPAETNMEISAQFEGIKSSENLILSLSYKKASGMTNSLEEILGNGGSVSPVVDAHKSIFEFRQVLQFVMAAVKQRNQRDAPSERNSSPPKSIVGDTSREPRTLRVSTAL